MTEQIENSFNVLTNNTEAINTYIEASKKLGILVINPITVREKYPKASAVLNKYIIDKFKNSSDFMDDLPEQFYEETAFMSLLYLPRNLYDFFDSVELFISIKNVLKDTFTFSFRDKIGKTYKNRIECEEVAFYEAFKVLEETLNKQIKTK